MDGFYAAVAAIVNTHGHRVVGEHATPQEAEYKLLAFADKLSRVLIGAAGQPMGAPFGDPKQKPDYEQIFPRPIAKTAWKQSFASSRRCARTSRPPR